MTDTSISDCPVQSVKFNRRPSKVLQFFTFWSRCESE